MPVPDSRLLQGGLQPQRVGPRVLRTANAAPLADVDHHGNLVGSELFEEIVQARVVDADGRDRPHREVASSRCRSLPSALRRVSCMYTYRLLAARAELSRW